MWDTYYTHCTKYEATEQAEFERHLILTASRAHQADNFQRLGEEPVVAFRTNWRGETFYSANTVLPAMETKHFKPFLDLWGNTKLSICHRAVADQVRARPNLPKHQGQYEEVFGANRKFVLLIEKGLGPTQSDKTDKPKVKAAKPASGNQSKTIGPVRAPKPTAEAPANE